MARVGEWVINTWSLAGGDLGMLDLDGCKGCESTYSSPSPAATAFRTLCKYIAQLRVVLVLVNVMYTDVPVLVRQHVSMYKKYDYDYIPL